MPPNIVIIEKIIFQLHHLSGNYTKRLSTALLNDKLDNKLEADKPKQEEGRDKEIIRKWLNKEGRTPVTWHTLIKVLAEIEMPVASG